MVAIVHDLLNSINYRLTYRAVHEVGSTLVKPSLEYILQKNPCAVNILYRYFHLNDGSSTAEEN